MRDYYTVENFKFGNNIVEVSCRENLMEDIKSVYRDLSFFNVDIVERERFFLHELHTLSWIGLLEINFTLKEI